MGKTFVPHPWFHTGFHYERPIDQPLASLLQTRYSSLLPGLALLFQLLVRVHPSCLQRWMGIDPNPRRFSETGWPHTWWNSTDVLWIRLMLNLRVRDRFCRTKKALEALSLDGVWRLDSYASLGPPCKSRTAKTRVHLPISSSKEERNMVILSTDVPSPSHDKMLKSS